MTKTSVQRDQQWRRAVQKSRSKEFSFGRGRFRLSTADLLSEGQNFEGGIPSTEEKHSDADNE
jgi:hypothetical protein